VLVIVALAIVALLVAAGLAIDGGILVFGRRSMQNAADAAALAGTRRLAGAICNFEAPDVADAAVYAEVLEYGERNGVSDPTAIQAAYVRFVGNQAVQLDPPVLVGSGSVPPRATGVVVTATLTRPTFFMTLIGLDDTTAGATATAVAGPPWIAGGMRPFGVPLDVMEELEEGQCFTTSFKNCDPAADEGDPNACYITDDSGEVIGQHRNWLNLDHIWNTHEEPWGFPRATGGSASAATLQEWMANGWDGMMWADCPWSSGCRTGDYIHAKPGTTSSPINDVPIGVEFAVPIYDAAPEYEAIPPPKPPPVAQGGNHYYHVVGFGALQVPTAADANIGAGTIRACIDEIILGEGQVAPNLGYGADICGDLNTLMVTLWR
jgi:Flp pilus assembly protein TadG